MQRSRKSTLLVLTGAAALLVALVAFVLMAADVNRDRPQLERAASDALGMNVRIGGRVDLNLFPRPHLAFADGRILDANGATVLAVKRVRVGVAWRPLLRGKLRLTRVELLGPRLSLERDVAGKVNMDGLRRGAALLGAIDGATLSISDGTLLYSDRRTGAGIEAGGVDLSVTRLRLSGGGSGRFWDGSTLQADLRCATLRTRHLRVSAMHALVTGRDGVFDFAPVRLEVFGGRAAGTVRADVSGPVPSYRVGCTLERFRIEEFLRLFSPKPVAIGTMDLSARLVMQGATRIELVRTTTGGLSLRGRHLTLTGHDLDRAISRFNSGHSFSLGDVGGIFLAGPLSLMVTRGYSFAGLFMGSGGTSAVSELVCDWNVERGVARAKDVALATRKNRIALQGRLDFVGERFDDVVLAAIDAHGCSRVRQVIRGPFREPTIEKPRVLATLAGPVLDVFGRIRSMVPGMHCPPFYSGSVAAPG